MADQFSRTKLLYGQDAVKRFKNSRVAVFGIGGVGGHIVEALVRSGIGNIDIIDNDTVSVTNINRQIIATYDTVGLLKTEVMTQRIKSIAPECNVTAYPEFFLPENSYKYDFTVYDYVVDAIDTVSGKLEIIKKAKAADVPVISMMGAGNKLDPTRFEVSDIYKTSVCPLAKVMRKLCRENNIDSLKVVYSKEEAIKPFPVDEEDVEVTSKRQTPGSNAIVPAVAGLIAASEILKYLAE